MADLHILRQHTLGFARARKIAFDWAEQVEKDFGMECTYEEGKSADVVQFKRSGVQGELHVTKDKFELDARLGFLMGAFKSRIEAEVMKLLDARLSPPAAAAKPSATKAAATSPAATSPAATSPAATRPAAKRPAAKRPAAKKR